MAGDRGRQDRAEQTRAHLIEVAALAFAEHGLDGISLNDVVKRSGVSKGAFYFHFSSKEELALAAFEAKQAQLLGRLTERAETQPTDASGALAEMWRRRNRLLAEDPSLACVTRLGGELNARSTPVPGFADFHRAPIELLAGLVRQGKEAGEFRSDLEPWTTAQAIYAWVVGIDALSILSSAGADLDDRTEDALTLLLPGLTGTIHRPLAAQPRPTKEQTR